MPDAKRSKCNQLGHEVVICKNNNQQQVADAQIVDGEEEDQLFVATCFSSKSSSECWLINSGCTNHMTNDKHLFKELKPTTITKVRIGNSEYIPVKGKGTVAIPSQSGSRDSSSTYYSIYSKQNRVSERRNKYIMEMTRCMLHEKNLPKKFWPEAANTSGFLQNKLPTKAVKDRTAFEACIDVYFLENEEWCWEDSKKSVLNSSDSAEKFPAKVPEKQISLSSQDEMVDHSPVKNDENWVAAMKEELFMIMKNMTWELVDQPEDRKVIGLKWVFRTKLNVDGLVNKHKAKLVVKGYAQIFGVDYFDTFAPVARLDTIRVSESTLYVKHNGITILVVSIYVDDVLVTWSNTKHIEDFKQEMMQAFEMNDLGLMSYFLGMEIKQGQNEVFICQKKYAKEILKKFNMEDCKEMSTPMIQKEKLSKNDGAEKVEETDWAGSVDDMKSTSEYCFSLGSGIFSWCSKKQDIVAQSTAEAEFVAAVVNQALWLRKIFIDLHMNQTKGTEVFGDNQSAIAISHNPVFHAKTKHFNIKLFLLREVQKTGDVFLLYCKIEEQLADIFTNLLLIHLQMLVYEFMPNGTLRDWLSGDFLNLTAKTKQNLKFGARLGIALGASKGILYLHTEADPPIFHRDVKASNILLDSKLTAKVADFGLSRLAPVQDDDGVLPNHVSTIVKGTPGYLDPEYFLTRKMTDKSDVYSLGVVFLEILTGMHPISHGKNIVREVNMACKSGIMFSILDNSMGSYPSECAEKFVALALSCCQDKPEDRPSMLEVVRTLETILRMIPYTDADPLDNKASFTETTSSSSYSNTRSGDLFASSSNVSGGDLISGVTLTITPR
ncbi:putative phospholipid-transporting ATPase 1-like [Capsicum annuum]|nr:putative phospholipid-transporting ATPase 1-like [Capsicum annuum]KAF3636185.1 putative phospholipid-transporting ATPase 1-like [Capsicum annuum]